MSLMTLQSVTLKSAGVTEKMVQEQIADDPSIPAAARRAGGSGKGEERLL